MQLYQVYVEWQAAYERRRTQEANTNASHLTKLFEANMQNPVLCIQNTVKMPAFVSCMCIVMMRDYCCWKELPHGNWQVRPVMSTSQGDPPAGAACNVRDSRYHIA